MKVKIPLLCSFIFPKLAHHHLKQGLPNEYFIYRLFQPIAASFSDVLGIRQCVFSCIQIFGLPYITRYVE